MTVNGMCVYCDSPRCHECGACRCGGCECSQEEKPPKDGTMRLSRWQLRRIRPGMQIQVSGLHWRTVLYVPFGFPWLNSNLDLDTGWSIHRDHITSIRRQEP